MISPPQGDLSSCLVLDTLRTVGCPEPGDYSLELLDTGGRVTARIPLRRHGHRRPVPDRTAFEAAGFNMDAAVCPDNVQSMRVRRGGFDSSARSSRARSRRWTARRRA